MKNFLEKLKRFSFLSLPLCFCSLVFLDYSFRFFYRFVGGVSLFSWKPMAFTAGWALTLTALIGLLPRLGRRIAMGVMAALFGLLALVHGVMFNIFGHFFTFADMNFAGDGAKFFSWSYLNLRKAFLLCILLFLLLMTLAAFLAQKPKPEQKRWKGRVLALCLAAVGAAPICFAHVQLTPKEDTMWWGSTVDANMVAYEEFTDSNRCVMLTGLYQYTFRNFAVSFGLGENGEDAAKLDAFFEERAGELSGDNQMTGALKGKNFIMVMMESVDTWLAVPEYMPNLCEMRDEGVDLAHFYTPLYLSAGTFNTEILSQTGLIPAVSGLSSAAYSINSFPFSLANLFRREGYTANSFHSAGPGIYSRGTVHTNLGFEAYHSYVDMGMDDYQLDSQMIRGYEQMTADAPFFTFIITYSGHGPYTEEMGNIAAPHYEQAKAAVEAAGVTGSPENMEEYTRAVAHAMETDQFLGELRDKLEQEGLLKDTVLLLYADHYGKYMTDKEFLKEIKGLDGSDPAGLYRTPCFFYGGGLAAGTVDKYASTADLAPTVANLFDLPTDRRYYVGDDIFGDKGGVVMLPNYAWYDGATYCAGAGEEADPREAEISADVRQRMNASMDAMRCDYFKSFDRGE